MVEIVTPWLQPHSRHSNNKMLAANDPPDQHTLYSTVTLSSSFPSPHFSKVDKKNDVDNKNCRIQDVTFHHFQLTQTSSQVTFCCI